MLHAHWRSNKYQFYNLWFNPTGLETTTYHTPGEHANHYTTNETTTYHTPGEHANHYTTDETTTYHTPGEHANHYTTDAFIIVVLINKKSTIAK
jgi:lipopolysaccharide export system protein LptC